MGYSWLILLFFCSIGYVEGEVNGIGGYTWQPVLTPDAPSTWQPTAVVDLGSPTATSITVVEDVAVIFGGHMTTYVAPYAWIYNLTSSSWMNNTLFSSSLLFFGGHSPVLSALATVNDTAYAIGGSANGNILTLDTQIQVLNSETWTWSTITTTTAPAPRYGTIAIFDGPSNNIYMYGGFSGGVYFDGLHKLDVITNVWTLVNGAFATPACFVDHFYDSYARMWYLVGGDISPGVPSNEAYIIDISSETKIPLASTPTPTREDFLLPFPPYQTPNPYTSIFLKTRDQDFYPTWNGTSENWFNLSSSISSQIKKAIPALRPLGTISFDTFLINVFTCTIFKLTRNTDEAFITSPLSTTKDVYVEFPTDAPIVSLIPKDDKGNPLPSHKSHLGFGEIAIELDGGLEALIDISKQDLDVKSAKDEVTGAETYTFSTQNETIAFEFKVLANDTTFQSGSSAFTVNKNAVKLTLKIKEWPFDSTSNYLRVRLPFETPFDKYQISKSNDTQAGLVSFKMFNGAPYATTIRCLQIAEINGTETNLLDIQIINNGNGTGYIDLFFPYFEFDLQYDPDFSVVFEGSDTGDSGDGDSIDSDVIIGLAVGLGVGIPLIAFFVFVVLFAVTGHAVHVKRKHLRASIELALAQE